MQLRASVVGDELPEFATRPFGEGLRTGLFMVRVASRAASPPLVLWVGCASLGWDVAAP